MTSRPRSKYPTQSRPSCPKASADTFPSVSTVPRRPHPLSKEPTRRRPAALAIHPASRRKRITRIGPQKLSAAPSGHPIRADYCRSRPPVHLERYPPDALIHRPHRHVLVVRVECTGKEIRASVRAGRPSSNSSTPSGVPTNTRSPCTAIASTCSSGSAPPGP
jgi:hypothetical protein